MKKTMRIGARQAVQYLCAGIVHDALQLPADLPLGLYVSGDGKTVMFPYKPMVRAVKINPADLLGSFGRELHFSFSAAEAGRESGKVELTANVPGDDAFFQELLREGQEQLGLRQSGRYTADFKRAYGPINSVLEKRGATLVRESEVFAISRAAQAWMLLAMLCRRGFVRPEAFTNRVLYGLRFEAESQICSLSDGVIIGAATRSWSQRIYANLPRDSSGRFADTHPVSVLQNRNGSGGGAKAKQPYFDKRRMNFYGETAGWERVISFCDINPADPATGHELIAHVFSLNSGPKVLVVFDTTYTGRSAEFFAGPEQQLLDTAETGGLAALVAAGFQVHPPFKHFNHSVGDNSWEGPLREIISVLRKG